MHTLTEFVSFQSSSLLRLLEQFTGDGCFKREEDEYPAVLGAEIGDQDGERTGDVGACPRKSMDNIMQLIRVDHDYHKQVENVCSPSESSGGSCLVAVESGDLINGPLADHTRPAPCTAVCESRPDITLSSLLPDLDTGVSSDGASNTSSHQPTEHRRACDDGSACTGTDPTSSGIDAGGTRPLCPPTESLFDDREAMGRWLCCVGRDGQPERSALCELSCGAVGGFGSSPGSFPQPDVQFPGIVGAGDPDDLDPIFALLRDFEDGSLDGCSSGRSSVCSLFSDVAGACDWVTDATILSEFSESSPVVADVLSDCDVLEMFHDSGICGLV